MAMMISVQYSDTDGQPVEVAATCGRQRSVGGRRSAIDEPLISLVMATTRGQHLGTCLSLTARAFRYSGIRMSVS